MHRVLPRQDWCVFVGEALVAEIILSKRYKTRALSDEKRGDEGGGAR